MPHAFEFTESPLVAMMVVVTAAQIRSESRQVGSDNARMARSDFFICFVSISSLLLLPVRLLRCLKRQSLRGYFLHHLMIIRWRSPGDATDSKFERNASGRRGLSFAYMYSHGGNAFPRSKFEIISSLNSLNAPLGICRSRQCSVGQKSVTESREGWNRF